MKKHTKLTAVLLVFAIMISSVASALSWPAPSSAGTDMPFRPSDKFVTDQNPPDFRWQYVGGAKSYELVVSKSEDLSSPVYIAQNLTTNYYNFDHTFETGVNYWWAVRFTDKDGNVSDYSTPRRFRISPDAREFTVPSVKTLLNRIPPSHPRILTTPDTLDEIRTYKDRSDYSLKAYNGLINSANNYVNRLNSGALTLAEPLYAPPETDDEAEFQQYQQSYRGKIQTTTSIAYSLGFAYMLSRDGENRKAEYALWGKKAIMEALRISYKKQGNTWVMDSNHPASFPGTSSGQSFREITYKCAMAYDWLYYELTDEERSTILELLKLRTEKMLGVISNTEINPHQSHGWTILGFLGIVGVATYGDIPDAENWLTRILPLYSNMLPPWGYEDGGWSQGVDYWQWSSSTNQEFMNVLNLAGIINLYDKAWAYKEYLWSMYVYPYGSYGSFGDGGGINKAGASSFGNIANTAYFTKNPVARWIVSSYGDRFDTTMESYYSGMLVNDEAEEPVDFPLGHEFDDIGWAVMTDSLTDTDRIQLTFKSSPFGSYNHVAAEQNAFFLQAYGEILAGKSGYYDSYHSPHHATISKATFAHNSVTVDGAKGQSNANINAKGNITQFVTHSDFSSVTGDASAAYTGENKIPQNVTPETAQGELDKFIRSIVYIRPGVFVVIDDLDAKGSGTSSFEWWLNSGGITDYTDSSAYVTSGKACLGVNVVYPKNTRATFYEGFVNPADGQRYPAGGTYETRPEQSRLKFATSPVSATKMIVTMSVYKDGEEEADIRREYASDGSYVRLIFSDGTVCVINLGDTTKEISDGTVSFKGVAATYNENSLMLTGGTSLSYEGKSIISATYPISSEPMTVALGKGQIAMSIPTDSNSGASNNVILRNNTKFISVDSEESLTDAQGRKLSIENGFYSSRISSSLIRLYPYKGNYNLYVTGAYVKPSELEVKNISILKNKDKFDVSWKEKTGATYDIMINNVIYENVTSPYSLDISSDENLYTVAIRGKSSSFEGQWSETVYLSPRVKNTYSHVHYIPSGDTVTAEVFSPNPSKESMRIFAVSHDGETGKNDIVFFEENKGIYRGTLNLYKGKASYVKTYLFAGDSIIPLTPAALMNSSNTNLKAIYAGGNPLEGYNDLQNEYNLEVSDYTFPSIDAIAEDNSSKVTIHHNYADLCTYVDVTAADGSGRRVTLSYVLPKDKLHLVSGATEESQFKYDVDRSLNDKGEFSGKKSASVVGTLKWKLVYPSSSGGESKIVEKSAGLHVYTNLMANLGGDKFGSRVTSDRKPNVFNFTEFSNAPKEFWGYDHLLFPNQNFIDNVTAPQEGYTAAHVEDASFRITMEEDAELCILSSAPLPVLEGQGFEKEALGITSNGSYMVMKPNAADVYYNVFLKGRPTSDLTEWREDANGNITYGYLRNYDVLYEWTDVNPITGYNTLGDYIDAGFTENNFTVMGNLGNLHNKSYYRYNTVYTKTVSPGEITVDLGDFPERAERMIVVVRPPSPKKPVTNFKYLGALSFGDLTGDETQGCTDDYPSKRKFSSFGSLPVMRTFKNGAIAYVDNTSYTIDNINPLLGLEGAYFMPVHMYLNSTETASGWMKAYYWGLSECGNYIYPGLRGESKPLYSFDLNQSATLYVITYGNTPSFIDDTWQRVRLEKPAFTVSNAVYKYTDMYIKNVDVPKGESVNVTMKTPATGSSDDGVYFLIVKPH